MQLFLHTQLSLLLMWVPQHKSLFLHGMQPILCHIHKIIKGLCWEVEFKVLDLWFDMA